MHTKSVLAIAAASMLFGAAPASSETVRVDCQYGVMTLERLVDGDCLSRIPAPTPRPDIQGAGVKIENADKGDRLAGKVYEYIETENPRTGDMRIVRVVGTRYLPNENSGYDLGRTASVASMTLNSAFYSVAQLFGVNPAQAENKSAVAEDNTNQQVATLEAQAEQRVLAAHN